LAVKEIDMRSSLGFVPLLIGMILVLGGCTHENAANQSVGFESPKSEDRPPVASLLGPEVALHYLGHSAFILSFDNGVTILTDDGESRTYGSGGPVHDVGGLEPDIVIYAHHYADQTRSQSFPDALVISGGNLEYGDISIRAIPVTEERPGDNYGYVISYKGFHIFYAGDSQGDMLAIDNPEVRQRLRSQLPEQLDLLMVPIDWKREITLQAVSYVEFLRPKRVVPMHYWSSEVKERFLDSLEQANRGYYIIKAERPDCRIFVTQPTKPVEVISLNAGPVVGI
jgi:L-ascorbate metabolism protein UlaG (beta-lactamase superfamily)